MAHTASCCLLVQVSYLRQLAAKGETLLPRDKLPTDAAYVGAPDSSVDIIAIEHGQTVATTHPDPDGALLQQLVEHLNSPSWDNGPPKAADDDCVYWAYFSLLATSSTKKEKLAAAHAHKEAYRIHTYYRVRVVILPEAQGTSGEGVVQYFEQGVSMAKLALSAFCQRILNSPDTSLYVGADPSRLVHLQGMLDGCTFSTTAEYETSLRLLKASLSKMLPVASDLHGFKAVVREAKVAFLRPGYIRLLARRHGPFPRRQDLKSEGLYDGVLPPGRIFSVSHGWSSEMHPSPSGQTLRLLVAKLDELGAHDEDDGVFLDYCSLPQKAHNVPSDYTKTTGAPMVQADRNVQETRQFRFAMFEMSRLYAFFKCEVIVIPELDSVAITHKTQEGGAMSVWGRVNSNPYENRGWCAAEFSVAMFHGRVVNTEDPQVRRIKASRVWPRTVKQYSEMMDEGAEMPVTFTSKGDRRFVQYNFFKMCIGLNHLQLQSLGLTAWLERRISEISPDASGRLSRRLSRSSKSSVSVAPEAPADSEMGIIAPSGTRGPTEESWEEEVSRVKGRDVSRIDGQDDHAGLDPPPADAGGADNDEAVATLPPPDAGLQTEAPVVDI